MAKSNFVQFQVLLLFAVVICAVNVECRARPQQIFVRQKPKVSRPPPIPPIIYGTPLRFQAPAAPRRPRQTNIGPQNRRDTQNPLLKKSTKNSSKPKKYGPAPPPPQIITARPSVYVAPKPTKSEAPKVITVRATQNIAPVKARNERQISPSNYSPPKPTITPKAVEVKSSKSVAPKQEKSEEPKIFVAPKQQKFVPAEAVRKERQVVAPVQPKTVVAKPVRKETIIVAPEQPKFIAAKPAPKARQFVAPEQPSFVAAKPIKRQVSSSNYNAPQSNYNAAPPSNIYHSSNFKAEPTTIEARTVAVPATKQSSYNAAPRSNQEPIAITRYSYNSPTGEEQEGDDVFTYDFGTENGISQK